MKYLNYFFLFSIVATFFALEAKGEEKKEEVEAKIYTELECKNKLDEEVNKKLRRVGQNRIVDFSKELLAKEESLKVKELEIKKAEEQLNLNMKDFSDKLKKFQEEQSKLLACIDDKDKEKSKRINHLVEVISGMKPEKAASVLSVQDADIAVQVMGLLEPVKVSKIFNLMDQEISARLQKQYMNMKR